MYNSKILAATLLMITILIAGCVQKKANFVVDKELLERKNIFKTSQEPKFTMKIQEGSEFLEEVDNEVNDTDGEWHDKIYWFVNHEEPAYGVLISMETVYMAEWNVVQPWTTRLENEIHGNKEFSCGIKISRTGKKNTSEKIWLYQPGGDGYPGTTRITIYYIEFDATNDLEAFIVRANERVDFTME